MIHKLSKTTPEPTQICFHMLAPLITEPILLRTSLITPIPDFLICKFSLFSSTAPRLRNERLFSEQSYGTLGTEWHLSLIIVQQSQQQQ